MTDEKQSVHEFPCEFHLKTFGKAGNVFEEAIHNIVSKHIEGITEHAFKKRMSKDNNYLSLTVVFMAESQAQLDALYQDLSSNEHVVMAL